MEAYLNKIARKGGYDPQTVESIRGKVREWVTRIGSGKLTWRDVADKVTNLRLVTEALTEKLVPMHRAKKGGGTPYTKEEIALVKERVRMKAAPLKFVIDE